MVGLGVRCGVSVNGVTKNDFNEFVILLMGPHKYDVILETIEKVRHRCTHGIDEGGFAPNIRVWG